MMVEDANRRARSSQPLSLVPGAGRTRAVVGGVVVLGVVFVAVVIGAVNMVWRIAGRSDPAVERLVAQTQLIVATLGLFLSTILTGATLYYAALTRRMASAAVASVEHQVLERTRAQADLVTAWVTTIAPRSEPPADGQSGLVPTGTRVRRRVRGRLGALRHRPTVPEGPPSNGSRVLARVVVRNASPVPVFKCTVLVRPHWDPFPPTSHVDVGSGRYWAVLPPGDVAEWVEASPADGLLTLPPVDIMFTDAAGLHWLRRGDGKLESLDENLGGVC